MFPGLSPLPDLRHPTVGLTDPSFSNSSFNASPLFVEIGGGGGGGIGFPGSGGINIGVPPIGSGSNPAGGSGSGKTVSIPSSPLGIATGMLSSLLGIPAINWGRIAAFLLGLILIAGGIYLIKPVQEAVHETIRGATVA